MGRNSELGSGELISSRPPLISDCGLRNMCLCHHSNGEAPMDFAQVASSYSVPALCKPHGNGNLPLSRSRLPFPSQSPIIAGALKNAATTLVFSARAECPSPPTSTLEEFQDGGQVSSRTDSSPIARLLESNPMFVENLESLLLQGKLENGEDEEALKILSAQLSHWRCSGSFLRRGCWLRWGDPRVHARESSVFRERTGYGQKNVGEALRMYEELAAEDPNDFRPGMIYSLLDQNVEARKQFAKFRELEVEGLPEDFSF
ncbi:hypothetical protein Dimus_014395 [Dionaea muscipula]